MLVSDENPVPDWDLSLASGGLILSARLMDELPTWAKRSADAEMKGPPKTGTVDRRIA